MDPERTIKKIIFEMKQCDLIPIENIKEIERYLGYAYAAGYDERGMVLNSHKTVKVVKYSVTGAMVRVFESISQAASICGYSRDTVSDNLRGKSKLTPDKKYYFKYAK